MIVYPDIAGARTPKIGSECEFSEFKDGSWRRGIVRYSSAVTVVIDIGHGSEHIAHPLTLKFRPVRTPEQIAAEEKAKVISDMCNTFRRRKEEGIRVMDCCSRLYDAGYRKQPKE